jgi:hypothetical protein
MTTEDFSKVARPKKPLDLIVACSQGKRDEFMAIVGSYPDSPRWVEPVTGGDAMRSLVLYHKLGPAEAQLLLDRGADINHRDNSGLTALMHALESTGGNIFVPLLLEARPDPCVQDAKGRTALDIARATNSRFTASIERQWQEFEQREIAGALDKGTVKPIKVRKPLSLGTRPWK